MLCFALKTNGSQPLREPAAQSGHVVLAGCFSWMEQGKAHCVVFLHRGIHLEGSYQVTSHVSVTLFFLLVTVYNFHILVAPEMQYT